MNLQKLFALFFIIFVFNSCSEDNLYEEITDYNEAQYNIKSNRSIDLNSLKALIEGKYRTLNNKKLLWDKAYTYHFNKEIEIAIIPVQMTDRLNL